MNEVLKNKDETILNPIIPRYEILKLNIEDGIAKKTGRKVNGKDEYLIKKQITTPAVSDNFSTIFSFTDNIAVHEMSNMVFPSNNYTGDQYPNVSTIEFLFRNGTGVIARVTSTNSWWANRLGIIMLYFTYN